MGVLFQELDGNGDGQIEPNEARDYINEQLGGPGIAMTDSATAAKLLSSLDGMDTDSTVSMHELEKSLSQRLKGTSVEQWVRHGLDLPQYTAAFTQHAISVLDFPLLIADDAHALEVELGVTSKLHRLKMVRAMRRIILGIGSPPHDPYNVECHLTSSLCGPGRTSMVVSWQKADVESEQPAGRTKYVVERTSPQDYGWVEVGSATSDASFLCDPSSPKTPPSETQYRVTAWCEYGPSAASYSSACAGLAAADTASCAASQGLLSSPAEGFVEAVLGPEDGLVGDAGDVVAGGGAVPRGAPQGGVQQRVVASSASASGTGASGTGSEQSRSLRPPSRPDAQPLTLVNILSGVILLLCIVTVSTQLIHGYNTPVARSASPAHCSTPPPSSPTSLSAPNARDLAQQTVFGADPAACAPPSLDSHLSIRKPSALSALSRDDASVGALSASSASRRNGSTSHHSSAAADAWRAGAGAVAAARSAAAMAHASPPPSSSSARSLGDGGADERSGRGGALARPPSMKRVSSVSQLAGLSSLRHRRTKVSNRCNVADCPVRPHSLFAKFRSGATSEFHYCRQCQREFCLSHTAYISHGRTLNGTCPLDAACMCEICWSALSPEQRAVLEAAPGSRVVATSQVALKHMAAGRGLAVSPTIDRSPSSPSSPLRPRHSRTRSHGDSAKAAVTSTPPSPPAPPPPQSLVDKKAKELALNVRRFAFKWMKNHKSTTQHTDAASRGPPSSCSEPTTRGPALHSLSPTHTPRTLDSAGCESSPTHVPTSRGPSPRPEALSDTATSSLGGGTQGPGSLPVPPQNELLSELTPQEEVLLRELAMKWWHLSKRSSTRGQESLLPPVAETSGSREGSGGGQLGWQDSMLDTSRDAFAAAHGQLQLQSHTEQGGEGWSPDRPPLGLSRDRLSSIRAMAMRWRHHSRRSNGTPPVD